MILPNLELLSLGIVGICIGSFLTIREKRQKLLFKCKICGTKELRARRGMIVCKNGHRVKIQD